MRLKTFLLAFCTLSFAIESQMCAVSTSLYYKGSDGVDKGVTSHLDVTHILSLSSRSAANCNMPGPRATAKTSIKTQTNKPIVLPKKTSTTIFSQKKDTVKQRLEEDTSPVPYTLAGTRVQMQGYRIQIYSGGNSRQARATAMSMGRNCQMLYPELGVYTSFITPRWVCYVGDFRTQAEAQVYVQRMRALGQFRQATVVRSKVLIPRTQLSELP